MSVKDFFVKTGRRIKSNFGWKSALFLVICIGMLAADLLTKHFAESDGWRFTVIPGFIEVVEVKYNDGASLGMGSGLVPLFIALTFIAIPIFIAAILLLPERAALLKFCIYMALAGAIGNLVDRIAFGKVRDFIYMNFGFIDFICNLADVWLMVGLVLAIIELLFLSEWAAFPLTKKARAAQAERRKQEERDKLGADPDGFDLPADPSDLAGYHVGPHCDEENVNDGEPGQHDEDSVSESEDEKAEDKNE